MCGGESTPDVFLFIPHCIFLRQDLSWVLKLTKSTKLVSKSPRDLSVSTLRGDQATETSFFFFNNLFVFILYAVVFCVRVSDLRVICAGN